jgi:SAM-dependent methyltransferase
MSNPFNEKKYLESNPDVAAAVQEGLFANGLEHFENLGRAEGRRADGKSFSTKEQKVLHELNLQGLGLEIGPSHNPIAPKKDGYNVEILDHLSAADLRAKYRDHGDLGVDTSKIEEVDYVWNGEPLSELIGETEKYDWIIASHVVEHIPDLITFLQECEKLLKPNGKLSLVVPEKNHCFDHFNSISATGDLLDAYLNKRSQPTPGQIFDYFANACSLDGKIAWDPASTAKGGAYQQIHTENEISEKFKLAVEGKEYIDVHCWRFVPESFDLIIEDLNKLGLLSLTPVQRFGTANCEFYVALSKTERIIETENRIKTLSKFSGLTSPSP